MRRPLLLSAHWLLSPPPPAPPRSFTGDFLGKQSDIASGELRDEELRKFDNIVGDYYVPPAFMDAVALHLVKNVLADEGKLGWKVPLILGIWGEKGCGKSFNVELACKKMKVQPIVMSAGELEDERAGRPGARRRRWRRGVAGSCPRAPARSGAAAPQRATPLLPRSSREAHSRAVPQGRDGAPARTPARVVPRFHSSPPQHRSLARAASRTPQTIKNSGVFSCLIINDIDAGVGRFRDTQVTVNNQTVIGASSRGPPPAPPLHSLA